MADTDDYAENPRLVSATIGTCLGPISLASSLCRQNSKQTILPRPRVNACDAMEYLWCKFILGRHGRPHRDASGVLSLLCHDSTMRRYLRSNTSIVLLHCRNFGQNEPTRWVPVNNVAKVRFQRVSMIIDQMAIHVYEVIVRLCGVRLLAISLYGPALLGADLFATS